MKVVGITGGIASGKSTVSSYLQNKYQAYIFDADKEAKVLLQAKDKELNKHYKGLTANLVKEAFNWDDNFMRINN